MALYRHPTFPNLLSNTTYLMLLCFLVIWSTNATAEGTKQWSPAATDNNYLKVNTGGVYAFGGYGLDETRRLHIHIKDPSNEVVYIGLSRMVNEPANVDITTAYQFRVRSPSGSIVHGPHSVSSPNITSHAMAVAGPNTIAAGGYPVGGMWTFTPTTSGDHYIEFASAGSIRWFDITVATTGANPTAIDGRIWSRAWTVRSDNGYNSVANAFDTPFHGALVAYDGKYATKIDFQGSGIRPLEGQFSFNTTGTGNTGNKSNDRRSVNGANSGNPEHKIFLNLPDPSVYPLQAQGTLQNLPLKIDDPANPDISIEVTQPGGIEILLDFDKNGVFTNNLDRLLFATVPAGVSKIPWDGKNAANQIVKPSEYPIAVNIKYSQGETHFTAYDVEGLDNGFEVYTQTSAGVVGPRLQFWDDTNIPDSPGTAGSSDAKVQVDSGATTRRRWNNNNYGDLNTINTWWYAYLDAQSTTVLMPGDYGDAPISYGAALHKDVTTPTIYLGQTPPDKESQLPSTLDGLGDDNDTTDDEDAFETLPELILNDTSYSLDIPCSGENAAVAGWIDFNLSNTFESTEKASGTCVSGLANLTWSSISGMTNTGTSYLRLRIASDANQITEADTAANDGEVEDYALEISPLKPTAFVCDGKPYTVIGSPSTLQEMNKTTLAVNSLGNFNPAINFNGIGYNTLDNFIYGYADGKVYRAGYNREIEDLGIPSGTGAFDPKTHTGTMDTSGKFYGISSSTIYIVDIGNNPAPGTLTFTTIPRTGKTTVMADIAFSTADGKLYGMSGSKLYRIDPTSGFGEEVSVTGDNLSGNAGGAWSTADGSVYLYNNSNGKLFKADTSQSPVVISNLGSVASNGSFDATACIPPALKKDASVSEIDLGQTFDYKFTINNPAATSITVGLDDSTPAHLSFVADSLSTTNPGGGSVATFTDTRLLINGITVPGSGKVEFTVSVKVAVTAPEGAIANQASLIYGLNTYVSDDPDTGAIEDPTIVNVLHNFDYSDAPDGIDIFNYGIAKHIMVGSPKLGIGKNKPEKEPESEITSWKSDWDSKMKGKHKGWFNKFKNKNKTNERVPIEPTDGDGEEEDGLIKGKFVWKNAASCSGLLPDGTQGTIHMDNQTFCLELEASNETSIAAQLVAWLDFNNNGLFDDPSERSVVNVDGDPSNDDTQGNVPAGTSNEKVVVYWNNLSSPTDELGTFIRIRLTTDPEFKSDHSPDPLGAASDGEVEDSAITLKPFSTLEIQRDNKI